VPLIEWLPRQGLLSIALIRHNKELFMDIRRFLLAAILYFCNAFRRAPTEAAG